MADIYTFRPRGDAPVQRLARDADECQRARIRSLAAEARNAFDSAHIDPALKAELSAKIGVVAEMCERLAEQAKSLGELRAADTLRKHQSLLETLSAEMAAEERR